MMGWTQLKRCGKCKQSRPLDRFDGDGYCRDCIRDLRRQAGELVEKIARPRPSYAGHSQAGYRNHVRIQHAGRKR